MNVFRRLLRPIPASVVAVAFAGSVWAATLSLLTGPLPAADMQGTLNTLINSINSAFGTAGGASLNQVIYAPTVTAPVNLFSMTSGATLVAPLLQPGGSGADTNIGIVVAGAGTGQAALGGTTVANSSLAAANTVSAVNHVVVTGSATAGITTIGIAGAGADANAVLSVASNGAGALLLGGATTTLAGLQIAQTASRVNDVTLTPGATGAIPIIASGGAGADANIGLAIDAGGTGSVYINGTTAANAPVSVASGTTNVNQIILTGTNTGTAPTITIGGSGADANRDFNVAAAGTGIITLGQTRATCSGTTTATCQGQRFTASVTGLTTAAAGVSATAMTVTNASVVSSASIVVCNVNGYSGTGQPIATNVTPGTGSVSFQVTNVASSGSLNATVPVACVVF